MKRTLAVLTVCVLAACGGGGVAHGGGVSPITANPAATAPATSTMTFQVEIPLSGTVVPQGVTGSSKRAPQYLAPQTAFILVDLQGNSNPQFDYTFLVTPANCPANGGSEVCTFTMTVPGGDPTTQRWSVATGAGKSDGSTGPPLSIAHDVSPCATFPCASGTATLNVFLNAVVANIFKSGLDWSPNEFPQLLQSVPEFTLTAEDAFGNTVRGAYSDNPPFGWGFANPFTLFTDDTTQTLLLNTIQGTAVGPAILGMPYSSQTFSTLANLHGGVKGIVIIDTATTTRTMDIKYSIPELELQPSEFPQLVKTWVSPAEAGTIMTVTCVPPAQAPAGPNPNPCTEVYP